ncbi:MAG: AAA family ATPase [Phormidesmis sp.]
MTVEKPPLEVHLLGDFCLTYRGETVTGLRGRSRQLLAYLILLRQSPQPRRRVAAALWPETPTSQALTNLRKELHYLRQADSPINQLLEVTPKTLYWRPQVLCYVDIDSYEAALASAEESEGEIAVLALETALSAYRGELWPDCDADWIYPERVRIQQTYIRALGQITRLLHSSGETAKAIGFGQRWLQADCLDEGATQTLMRLYGEAGDRATALRLYHQCMSALQTELGVSPSPTTADIYQQLLMGDEAGSAKIAKESPKTVLRLSARSLLPLSASSTVMVGRDTLFQQLQDWLLAPADNAAPLLLLTGEPGIGKTRLLEALAHSAVHHHWQLCWGRAFAAEQLRAYGVWIDLLRTAPSDWATDFGVVLSESAQERLGHSPERLRQRGQLLDIIVQGLAESFSPAHPLLLLFDDIQWLDEASTTLLHYVFRLLGQGSLRIACAARAAELQDNSAVLTLAKSLRRANRLQEIAVPPLSADSVSALVKSLQSEPQTSPLNLQQLYADSGGNPLFALEIARANNANTHALQSTTLAGLIEDRLQRLDGAARDLLPWAAALGRRFDPEILALAASYPPMKFLLAIEQLEQQNVVRPAPTRYGEEQHSYDFVHDLVRQVAYEQLSAPRRCIVHGQLATTLKAQMVDDDLASQVAYHAGLAGKHTLAAQVYTAAAARSLRLFAYAEAIQLVAQGLAHCQFLPSCDRLLYSAQLWRSRVFAGVSRSESSTVEQHLRQLLADMQGLALTEAETIAHQTLAYLSYDQDNINEVHRQCLKSLDFMQTVPYLQAETLAASGSCLAMIERDMDRAEALLLEAQTLAARLDLPLIDISLGLGCLSRYRGDYDLARAHLQQALQLSKNQQDHIQAGYCLCYLALTAWDDHQPSQDDAQALLNLSPQLPQGSDAAFAQALIALQAYAEKPGRNETLPSVIETLKHLDQLDAQRKLAFIASHAAEVALNSGDMKAAKTFAITARQSAKTVDHPNDGAIAETLCLLWALTAENKESIQQHWQALQTQNADRLSARAQALIAWARQMMIQLGKTPLAEISSLQTEFTTLLQSDLWP